VVGVSIGGLKTLMAEYHEDGTVYVSDACQHRDTSVVDVTTKIGQVRSFLDLALPFTLPLQLCTKHGRHIYRVVQKGITRLFGSNFVKS